MYFQTLDDPQLLATGARAVEALRIDHFFNVQLVGDFVIEVNPRISTVVYQEDLNLPYLGLKHALGEISDGRPRHACSPHSARAPRASVL